MVPSKDTRPDARPELHHRDSAPMLLRRESARDVDLLLQEHFKLTDQGEDGMIDARELQRTFSRLGLRMTEEETSSLLAHADRDHDEKVSLDDFRRLHEEFVYDVFRHLDADNDGFVDSTELKDGFSKLGIDLTTNEAKQMIKVLDMDNDERLNLQEFRDLYRLLKKTKNESMVENFLWDPEVRNLSRVWVESTVDVGEGGLGALLPVEEKEVRDSSKVRYNQFVRLAGGMTSGVIEALCLTPLDVTKTRLQLDHTGRYRGMLDCGTKLFRAEGVRGLYKGFVPWTAHVVSKNGARFYFNSLYKSMLRDKNGEISGRAEFFAGAMVGVTEAVLIVTPFEVIKTRMQAQDKSRSGPVKYRNTLQSAMLISRTEGPTALWKGLSPTIVRQGMNQACSFYTNSILKKYVWQIQEGEYVAPWKSAITGMVGAIPGPLLNCPADVIKSRLMNQESKAGEKPKYRGFGHAFRTIWKEEGFLALYKGLGPRLMRLCPSYGIQWVVIDQFVNAFAKK